jgi:hypothetical protein
MGIVDANRLNRFLAEPKWTPTQWLEAEALCASVEASLEGALMTFISPRSYRERVSILGTGLVATRHPVVTVDSIDGATVPSPGDITTLPEQWTLQERRLRWVDTDNYPPLPNPSFSLLGGWSPVGTVQRLSGVIGSVLLGYQAGLIGEPQTRTRLELAILRKAGTIFLNRHDDTVVVRDLDSQQPPPVPSEDWSTAELMPYEDLRNLAAFK